jgi:hypothetical protein
MSVESLILLALFILLPLIERFILAARRRRERAVAEGPEADMELPPFLRPEERAQPVVMPPPLPPDASARPKPLAATSRLRAPQRPAVATALARAASASSPYRRDLRRAVVMAAVLGPCRALSPYDDPRL